MDENQRATAKAALASLHTRADVASFVGLTAHQLKFYLFGLGPKRRYVSFELKKRGGGTRQISAPIVPVKIAQKVIATHLAAFYEPRRAVFGYVEGRGIIGNAASHSPKRWVLRVDLKDFFPSINFGRVRGLLLASPFKLEEEVATTIAQICTNENQLPQGSPASPLISNVVCRGLDRTLAELARAHRCSYTRYCDDIVFSTNRGTFPRALGRLEEVGEARPAAVLGEPLVKAITDAGFQINEAKTQLRSKSQRQMVTGLVTNVRVNVPRKFVLEVRQILHAWKRLGTASATDWYFSRHDKRNRPPGKQRPPFAHVVRGKVQHVGAVRGWGDPLYRRFASRLSELDPTFRPHQRSVEDARVELHVFTEGKTDRLHIQTALAHFRDAGKYTNLRLIFSDDKDRGGADLLKFCEHLSQREQSAPCVFLFDSDEKDIVKRVVDSAQEPKDWGNSVFSLVVPTPGHRQTFDRICIELLFTDNDFSRRDAQERRLFQRQEFNFQNGRHVTDPVYCVNTKATSLVLEDGVFELATGKKISLSKIGFAELIASQAPKAVDFGGFEPLFDALEGLRRRVAALPL